MRKAGYEVPAKFDWSRTYSPALHELACNIAQKAYWHTQKLENIPPLASLLQDAERLGRALGLSKPSPASEVVTPAVLNGIVAPLPDGPKKS